MHHQRGCTSDPLQGDLPATSIHRMICVSRSNEQGASPTSSPDDHCEAEPPDPIPNSEVKRFSADGSAGLPRARVGHRQVLHRKGPFRLDWPLSSFQARRLDDDLRPRRSRGESRVSRDRRASGTSQPGERPEAPCAGGPDIVRFPRSGNAATYRKGHPPGLALFRSRPVISVENGPEPPLDRLPGPTVPFRRRTRKIG